MANLTTAQKIYAGLLLGVGAVWLGLKLGIPAYEYAYGKTPLTALLAQMTPIIGYAVFGIAALAWVLQRVGVLPTVPSGIGPPGIPAGLGRLRNLVLWVVIALLLVLLFNLFQAAPKHHMARSRVTAAIGFSL